MTDNQNDLFWHALNYRTAATQHAEEMWQELAACVERKVAAPWQPIESAPRDEWLLVFHAYGEMAGCVTIAQLYSDSQQWSDWDGDLYGTPAVWMPLPKPPE